MAMTKQDKAKLYAQQGAKRAAEKAERERAIAERAARFAVEHAACVQRHTECLMALDVVPADDYAVIAAQELAEEFGLDIDDLCEVIADSGQDWPSHQRWIKRGASIFLFQAGDYIYPATVTAVNIAALGADVEFYRGTGDVPLLVDVGRTIPRQPATWLTVDKLGTHTHDGDKVLVVGDDDLHLQDISSSAFSVVAVGNYKLSDLKKPESVCQDFGDWLE